MATQIAWFLRIVIFEPQRLNKTNQESMKIELCFWFELFSDKIILRLYTFVPSFVVLGKLNVFASFVYGNLLFLNVEVCSLTLFL